MKVTEHVANAKDPLISFEITPPKRGLNLNDALQTVGILKQYNPAFIDVTYHPIQLEYRRDPSSGGIEEVITRKYPGTRTICSHIQLELDAVPHILCRGFSRHETSELLAETKFDLVRNILVVQGDNNGYNEPHHPTVQTYNHPSEIIPQIKKEFGDDFCIGVAGYPEKHFESPNLRTDMDFFQRKVESGADYAITQMLFNNSFYFKYLDRCKKRGINIPIIPGVKVITSERQLVSIPSEFHVEIPYELSKKISAASKEDRIEIGIDWTTKQVQKLISQGVPITHFYIFGDPTPTLRVLDNLSFGKKD